MQVVKVCADRRPAGTEWGPIIKISSRGLSTYLFMCLVHLKSALVVASLTWLIGKTAACRTWDW